MERLKINQFYCAPTALRLLLKYGDEYVKKYDRSSLTTLGSGENEQTKFYVYLKSRHLLVFCGRKTEPFAGNFFFFSVILAKTIEVTLCYFFLLFFFPQKNNS